MSQESTTPDLVDRARRGYESFGRRDLDAVVRFWGPDPVWDMSHMGLGVYEGREAIRRFFEEWFSAYEEYEFELEQILDLGNGVVFAVTRQKGRPVGSTGYVEMHQANVGVWVEGLTVRLTHYNDIDEARVAAERLAEERADG